jgi:WD40 repeat protein/tRNA A-37 threonylcarbamoyl transferase component Bud32
MPCPTADDLRRSLDPDDPMAAPERASIAAHASCCECGCKAVIETLTRHGTRTDDSETTRPASGPGDAAPEHATPAPPGYEVLGELGRGGMGVVYKARQARPNRLVAIKMILAGAHAGPHELARFRAEAEAVAALRHPNVVEIHEVGEHDGLAYFSLEYCAGGTLAQKLAAEPQPPGRAAELVETLARAVHHAHLQGIVHRDLKPANVLLTGDGLPKITDFGLAKQTDAVGPARDGGELTRTGAIMGTPSYMAPEQARGESKAVGPASDVYALGAILYECLTGRPPFRGATARETLEQVLGHDPVPPRQLQPRTPRDLETICLKCLTKEPDRRYASAADLADDLGRQRRGEPVRARPPSLVYVLGKQVRRHRAPLAVAAAMLVVLAVVTAVAFVKVVAARDEAVSRNRDLEIKEGELTRALIDRQAALGKEQVALGRAERTLGSLKEQLAVLARGYAGRADLAHRAGDANAGLAWLLRAREVAPADDPLREECLRLLAARARCASVLALPHEGVVTAAAFSPDGRRVVTGSLNSVVRVWDASTGKEQLRCEHDGGVQAAAFRPDGRAILTASDDKSARLWDATTGKELLRVRHEGWVFAASFGRDGKVFVTGGADNTARLWDATSGKELQRFAHDEWIKAAALSPDGRTVLTGSDDRTARLWDVASGKELLKLPHDAGVKAVAFSTNSRAVATASLDGHTRVWDVANGKELLCVRWDAPQGTVAFSPDGRAVLTGGQNGAAHLVNAGTGVTMLSLPHDGWVDCAAFSPDGLRVVTAGRDQVVRIWDASLAVNPRRLKHAHYVQAAAFSPDGRTLVTGCQDKVARLWNVADGKGPLLQLPHDSLVKRAVFSPDGKSIATAGLDKTARLWDVATGKELHRFPHKSLVGDVSFRPDGRVIITGCYDTTARLWDAADGTELGCLKHDNVVSAASFSPDGRTVVTASAETVRLWDADSGRELRRFLHRDQRGAVSLNTLQAAAFSPDGRTILTAAEKSARLWDAATGKEQFRFPHDRDVYVASFSPDGQTIATAGMDGTARLWDAATGKELLQLKLGDAVWAAAFHPDGRTLVTTAGAYACLWDVGPLAAPDGADAALLRAWVLVRTGKDVAPDGTIAPMGRDEWERQRATLEAAAPGRVHGWFGN